MWRITPILTGTIQQRETKVKPHQKFTDSVPSSFTIFNVFLNLKSLEYRPTCKILAPTKKTLRKRHRFESRCNFLAMISWRAHEHPKRRTFKIRIKCDLLSLGIKYFLLQEIQAVTEKRNISFCCYFVLRTLSTFHSQLLVSIYRI